MVRVSNHTEVNFRVVIDRHIDLFLGLGWPAVILWWVVVRNSLHRLLNQLVALVFESLSISVFSRVDTSAMVVVLGGWRRRSSYQEISMWENAEKSFAGTERAYLSPSAGTTSSIRSF